MQETPEKIKPVYIEYEMKNSFLNYAMSVIVSRALPDVRDGLKPVHRRILYAMHDMGLAPNRSYKKSAHIVGETMAKYHPHGDAAIYDTLVRMAQDFSMRYMLVDGQGNFGSVDGDPPAAYRYTEARMAKIATEMIQDIEKETVNFVDTYDGSNLEPAVLPSRIPNLLMNGSSGIAVGMATNIPPHNLGELLDGLIRLIDNPEIEVEELAEVIKGPDFPTGGNILGRQGIKEAYATGRGQIVIRGVADIEPMKGNRFRIVVSEIPYMVNKADMIGKIADLVKEKKIEEISDIRDESDRTGMRVVIELKRDANPNVVLNKLYKHTTLQSSFGVNMICLVDGQPKLLNLRQMLVYYLEHRKEVITRRTEFELKKAKERAHILEGLKIALDHIDEVIEIIRASKDGDIARSRLMKRFELSELQAQAILDMRLQRLTGLEREKIDAEYEELIRKIAYYEQVLENESMVFGIIKEEFAEIREKYSDARRTAISSADGSFDEADLVQETDVVITITRDGYVKRLPINSYRVQRRGGKGIKALTVKQEDKVEHIYVTSTHETILFFTNKGLVYRLKGYQIPQASRTAKGTPIINLVDVLPGEIVTAVMPIRDFSEGNLFMATVQGMVKKTALTEYDTVLKTRGLIAMNIKEDDELKWVTWTEGDQSIFLVTRNGMSIHFSEKDVRPMGRATQGVRGITLNKGDKVVGMDTSTPGANLMVVTEKGYGKKTTVEEYKIQRRGGKGIKTLKITDKNGPIVGIAVVEESLELLLLTKDGIMIRQKVSDVRSIGRSTQGVIVKRLDSGDAVVAMEVYEGDVNGNGDIAPEPAPEVK